MLVTYFSSFAAVLYSVPHAGCWSVHVAKQSKRSFRESAEKTNVLFLSACLLPTGPPQIQTLPSLLRSLEGQRNALGVVILFMQQRK